MVVLKVLVFWYSNLCQVGFVCYCAFSSATCHHQHIHRHTHTHRPCLHASASFSCSAGDCQTELSTISLQCCSIMQDISPDTELSWPSGLKDGNAKEQKVEQ